MLFKKISILNKNYEVEEDMYVGVEGNHIDYIGKERPKKDYSSEFDGSYKLLMPGLVNSHTHVPMTLLRGYAENLSLHDWLNTKVFPFEDRINKKDAYYGTSLGILEMLRFGITSMSEMYFHCDSMAEAILDGGIKCNLSHGVTAFDDSDFSEMDSYKETLELMENYGDSDHGRLKVDLCIHAEYTTNPKIVSQVSEYAKETGSIIQVHLSETKSEHEECKVRRGKTPARYFYDLGLFDNPTVAAHGVYLEDADMDLLAEKNVTVATCPVSNLKLASGICRVPDLIKHGVNVALGTDGVASNNSHNLFEELKLLAILHKAQYQDPTLITPKDALKIATVNGAKAQGREDTGVIEVGKRADLIVLDMDRPYMFPVHSVLNNVVYSAQGSDVCLTMVDGKILYHNGEYTTLDMDRIIYEVRSSVKRIIGTINQ